MRGGSQRTGGSSEADRVATLVADVVAAHGMDLEQVRVTSAGRRRLLRVVVDSDRGVSLDETADVSRELSTALDAADTMGQQPYTLEVSSPGVDRPLTRPRHWRRAVGRLVRVDCPPAGVVEGRVLSADDGGITVDVDGDHRRFGYERLGPGEICVEFGRTGGEGAPGGPGTGGPGAESDGH